MSKPPLIPELSLLERDIGEIMLAGLHRYRPDLHYPESASDMQACIRALLTMYEVKRRPLPEPLAYPCDTCMGTGCLTKIENGIPSRQTCPECRYGKVYY